MEVDPMTQIEKPEAFYTVLNDRQDSLKIITHFLIIF